MMKTCFVAILFLLGSSANCFGAYALQAGVRGGAPGQGEISPQVFDAGIALSLVELDLFLVNDTAAFTHGGAATFSLNVVSNPGGPASLFARNVPGGFVNGSAVGDTVAPFNFATFSLAGPSSTFAGGHFLKIGEIDVQLTGTPTSIRFEFADSNDAVGASGWTITDGEALTGAEDAALYANSANGFSVVPEPSSMALLGFGIVGMTLRRRRAR